MKNRTLIGLTLIISSLALYGGGGFIIKQAVDEKARQAEQHKATETQCLRHLEEIPDAKVQNGGQLTVTVSPVTNPMEALSTASMALMMCPTRDMASFCLGDKCQTSPDPAKPTVSMVIKFVNAKE